MLSTIICVQPFEKGNTSPIFQSRDIHNCVTVTKQVIKVICQRGRIAAAHGQFNHIRQVAPTCKRSDKCSVGQPESIPKTASRSVQPFMHSSLQNVPILYNGRPFPLKIAPAHGRSGPLSNTRFLGSTRVHNPTGISIGSCVFPGLTAVANRQTDRQKDRPRYLRV